MILAPSEMDTQKIGPNARQQILGGSVDHYNAEHGNDYD